MFSPNLECLCYMFVVVCYAVAGPRSSTGVHSKWVQIFIRKVSVLVCTVAPIFMVPRNSSEWMMVFNAVKVLCLGRIRRTPQRVS